MRPLCSWILPQQSDETAFVRSSGRLGNCEVAIKLSHCGPEREPCLSLSPGRASRLELTVPSVVEKQRPTALNRRDATRAHKDEITSRINSVATKLRQSFFSFFSASRRVIAANNPTGWCTFFRKAEVTRAVVFSLSLFFLFFYFFFYLFFCGELDSSASGSHDGFIRGLQPLSCFSL